MFDMTMSIGNSNVATPEALRLLNADEIDEISGGFVCGGLCIAGAFALGAAIGGGITWLILR